MTKSSLAPEQGELPLGDNIVRLQTQPARDVKETLDRLDEYVDSLKFDCPNMVAFFIVAIDGDGKSASGGYRSGSCRVPAAMMPEVMRNAIIIRMAQE